jgi:hypothetical protein
MADSEKVEKTSSSEFIWRMLWLIPCAVLEGDLKLIDWRDDTQRKRFLNERQVIAERLVSQ